MNRLVSLLLTLLMLMSTFLQPLEIRAASEADSFVPTLKAPSAILLEAETGTVVYEKNSHEVRPPASITKIMTLDLIFEALEEGQIKLTDEVTVSEHAAGMGGSQVYLEPGETQTVETMIKCISISSANDACVAMAELLAGSEEAFVEKMNEKASALGMADTHFINSCGLDTAGHETSAYDVALMSRDLTLNHPAIHDYCTIWMDTIIHHTKKGDQEFGLTNTNKLIRQYPYATGLKTGSTSQAKYCLSATAEKDGLKLIAVVMASPDGKARVADAKALLDYGFATCSVYRDENPPALPMLPVAHGTDAVVPLSYSGTMMYVSTQPMDISQIKRRLSLPKSVDAPVQKGEIAGHLTYYLGDRKLITINIRYERSVDRAGLFDYYRNLLSRLFFAKPNT